MSFLNDCEQVCHFKFLLVRMYTCALATDMDHAYYNMTAIKMCKSIKEKEAVIQSSTVRAILGFGDAGLQ